MDTVRRLTALRFYAGAAVVLAAALSRAAEPAGNATAQPFSYAVLKLEARHLADKAYQLPRDVLPKSLASLTYDEMQQIRFKPGEAIWSSDDAPFRIRLFHLGLFNHTPVAIYLLDHGEARELKFTPELFEYGRSGVDPSALPADLGFAGFQVFFRDDWNHDIAAFQGASYFRAVGRSKQYGLSARGLAIDCGLSGPEEFPRFTKFYLERPEPKAERLTVYSLLDSPSVTGAYRFEIAPGEPLAMDVDAALYPRKEINELGVAPMTSMFLVGENDRRVSADFRPEIHDSDGLAIHNGRGEWIWRPLANPPQLRMSLFQDDGPRGFGLVQRDRVADHYQDEGARYERRPSCWVEPKSGPAGAGWGQGAVRLVEIPTVDETFDNIVAFWTPEKKPKAGDELLYSYSLYWGDKAPHGPLAMVRATRTGIGGTVGQKRTHFSWRFVVDFAGGKLATLPEDAEVEPIVTASRGKVELLSAGPLKMIDGYRAIFDLAPDDSTAPVDLRLYLRYKGEPLTETWLYQWTSPALSERKF